MFVSDTFCDWGGVDVTVNTLASVIFFRPQLLHKIVSFTTRGQKRGVLLCHK
jgi:hypothetical protein